MARATVPAVACWAEDLQTGVAPFESLLLGDLGWVLIAQCNLVKVYIGPLWALLKPSRTCGRLPFRTRQLTLTILLLGGLLAPSSPPPAAFRFVSEYMPV